MQTVWEIHQKLKVELAYELGSHFGIYIQRMERRVSRDSYTLQ